MTRGRFVVSLLALIVRRRRVGRPTRRITTGVISLVNGKAMSGYTYTTSAAPHSEALGAVFLLDVPTGAP